MMKWSKRRALELFHGNQTYAFSLSEIEGALDEAVKVGVLIAANDVITPTPPPESGWYETSYFEGICALRNAIRDRAEDMCLIGSTKSRSGARNDI